MKNLILILVGVLLILSCKKEPLISISGNKYHIIYTYGQITEQYCRFSGDSAYYYVSLSLDSASYVYSYVINTNKININNGGWTKIYGSSDDFLIFKGIGIEARYVKIP